MRRLVRGRGPVIGPTEHVVVVGAGLGGLSAALRLAGAGRSVTVVERDTVPGGRAGVVADSGYRFDTGPVALMMPELIADALACVGEDLDDWLELTPLSPLYRAHYPDGTQLDVLADVDAMADEISLLVGPAEAAGYRRLVDFVTELYRVEMAAFVDRNIDTLGDLLTPQLARLVAMGGFRRMAPKIGQFLSDPRTQRVFSFQAMYAGMSPHQALAIYSIIAYMDTVAGVFFPTGGIHAVPTALAGAAEKHGVRFRYGTMITRVEHDGRRATAVITSQGERIPADVVVLNPDLPVAYRDLLGVEPWSIRRLRYAPSCAVLLAGSRTRFNGIAHHNIHFGRQWRDVFADVIDRGRTMADPSLFVTNATRTDSGLAPPDRETYYVLFPTPNLDAPIDWATHAARYRDHMVATLEQRGYVGFGDAIEVEHLTTPREWGARGMERGTPFAASLTFSQSGPFRPANRWGENVVFTGSGTHPGVGVPPVLISGRLAAERIVGPTR